MLASPSSRYCMDTYINLSNLEGRKKVFLVLFLLIFNLFFPSLVPSSCTLLCHRGSFWVSLSQVRKMSLLHVVWERKVEGMLQRTLSVELCLRWMSSPGCARDGPSLLSAQFGGWEEEDSLLLATACGEDRDQVAEFVFQNILVKAW